jgi:uncharacterized OsmC-like protein
VETTMTDDRRLADGVDLDALERFRARAAEDPEEVRLALAAAATYEGTCGHSLARIAGYELGGETVVRETREYTIPYGGWKEVLEAGGWVDATDRLEPIEVTLSALAACINLGITVNAAAAGVAIDRLQTRVRADVDPAVLLGVVELTEGPSVFENLTAEVEVDGEALDADLLDEWARRAPVYTFVSLAQDVDLTITTSAHVTDSKSNSGRQ